jgi:hypothetical protein
MIRIICGRSGNAREVSLEMIGKVNARGNWHINLFACRCLPSREHGCLELGRKVAAAKTSYAALVVIPGPPGAQSHKAPMHTITFEFGAGELVDQPRA